MKNSKLFMVLVAVVGILLVVLAANDEKRSVSETEVEYSDSGDETKILLYFSDLGRTKLMQEYRYVSLQDIKTNMLEKIVSELIKGPVSSELSSTIPTNTKINSIKQDGNKVVVDFSAEFNEESGDQNLQLQKIYSVVNSLTEIKEIEEVEILVDGKLLIKEKRL